MTAKLRRTVLVPLVVAVGLIAACTDSTSPTANNSSSASSAPPSKAPYSVPGPFAVGFTTLHLDDGRRVVVWYPAVPDATAGHTQESIDIASFLSTDLQAKVPAEDRVLYPANAFDRAPPASQAGGFPVVLFSHGFAGYPEQSVSLTTHLASWGFVVAAPDHVERSLDGLLGTAGAGVARRSDPDVLQATLDVVLAASSASGVLHGLASPDEVAVIGHSAGASAAYETAQINPNVKAWISYSVGPEGSSGPPPDKPGMVMLGTTDGVIPPAESEAVYAAMRPPKYLVRIEGAGHLVFSDVCLIGRSAGGVTGIAEKLQLPIPPDLLRLGSDGCGADHPAPETAFPAIDQLSVAFLRSALGIDSSPVGLDTAAVADLGATVTVEHQG